MPDQTPHTQHSTQAESATLTAAVIYCRVSSTAQVKKGDGLGSQETRCREYAKRKGYTVVQVFLDKGVSGGLIDRPGITDMLAFLRKHKRHTRHAVIIDDISRLARDMEAHIDLRAAISVAGGELESPSIEFGEDSDSRLIEHLLASVSQHHREKTKEQTKNRMRARVQNGYWVFHAPPGYRYKQAEGGGKILIRDEPTASQITQALEGFASGRFQTQAEVKRFLEGFPDFPRNGKDGVRFEAVNRILTQQLYAGIVEVPRWNVTPRDGKHEALIDKATWARIKERLSDAPRVPARKDINEDFPLRGFVACGCCGHPMSAAWAKGRNRRYAYYSCFQKGCADRRKSIAKDKIEGEFDTLVKSLRPNRALLEMGRDMWRDLWEARAGAAQTQAKTLKHELKQIGRDVEKTLGLIMRSESTTVIGAYESKIREMEERKLVLAESLQKSGKPQHTFEQSFRTAFAFLANPWKLWASERLEDRRALLRLVFAAPLTYCRETGFRTAKTTFPFKALADLDDPEYQMADRVTAISCSL